MDMMITLAVTQQHTFRRSEGCAGPSEQRQSKVKTSSEW
jgi:hypothetical protein